MKKSVLIFTAIAMLFSFNSLFAEEINLENMTTTLRDTMLDNTMIGGTWGDAYIGQLLSVPPHFGVGVSAGLSRLKLGALKDVLNELQMDYKFGDNFIVPNYAIEARIGGILLPFDLGARFGIIPKMTLKGATVENLACGADVRFPILEGSLVLPKLSIGLGYHFGKGGISYSRTAEKYGYDVTGNINLEYKVQVLEAKAQISKQFVFITPYLGYSAFLVWSDTTTSIEFSNYLNSQYHNDIQKAAFNSKIFGGLQFDILVVKLDLNGFYNFNTKNWAANFGVRFQL